MPKRKFVPIIEENPQSRAPIHGRGASWSPANRFDKLHVDLTDVDVVDDDPEPEEKPRRATQYFRDQTKTIIARMETILRRIGQAEGYTLILERNEAGVVWVPANLDLTDVVIQKYNTGEGRDVDASWAGFITFWLLVPCAVAGTVLLRRRRVAITPDGADVYVTTNFNNTVNNTVSVIATSTSTVVTSIAAGSDPAGLALTPNGAKIAGHQKSGDLVWSACRIHQWFQTNVRL